MTVELATSCFAEAAQLLEWVPKALVDGLARRTYVKFPTAAVDTNDTSIDASQVLQLNAALRSD